MGHCNMVQVSLGDSRVDTKEIFLKFEKYQNLVRKLKITILPVIIGVFGETAKMPPKRLKGNRDEIRVVDI